MPTSDSTRIKGGSVHVDAGDGNTVSIPINESEPKVGSVTVQSGGQSFTFPVLSDPDPSSGIVGDEK